MNFSKYQPDLILIIHFILGVTAGMFPGLVFYWVLLVFTIGIYGGLNKSFSIPPFLFATYLSSMELLGRMSASGLPHEFTKYAVSAILLLSLFFQPKTFPRAFIAFILLLVPSVFLTDGGNLEETRQLISANLSGPFCLAISVFYFYDRIFDLKNIRKLFQVVLYPLAATVGYLTIKTPDFSEIEFGFQSNFSTSIYGPNQMSSILGLGILIIGLAYFLRIRLFGSHLVSLALFGLLLFRGLITFSRGGMLTPAILLSIIFLYFFWKSGGLNKNMIRTAGIAIIVALVGIVAFNYSNKLTGNALINRYSGVKNGKQIEDINALTSGRTMIVYMDWQIFKDNPVLGAGVGMGKYLRGNHNIEVAAHNEFSRLLAEHGLFGLSSLLILIFAPVTRFFSNRNIFEKAFLIAFIGFCFVFMTHAATRLAAPCLLFGLAFIRIVPSLKLIQNNGFISRQYAFKARQVARPYGDTGS